MPRCERHHIPVKLGSWRSKARSNTQAALGHCTDRSKHRLLTLQVGLCSGQLFSKKACRRLGCPALLHRQRQPQLTTTTERSAGARTSQGRSSQRCRAGQQPPRRHKLLPAAVRGAAAAGRAMRLLRMLRMLRMLRAGRRAVMVVVRLLWVLRRAVSQGATTSQCSSCCGSRGSQAAGAGAREEV